MYIMENQLNIKVTKVYDILYKQVLQFMKS